MIEYTAIAMLYTSVQTALLACIRYWLYQDSLRVTSRRMYIILFILAVGSTGVYAALGGISNMPFSYFRVLIAASMYILSCFIIREPFSKHTYTYSFILVYDSAIEITASFAQSRIMPGDRGLVFMLTAALLLAVSFVPAVRYLKKMIDRLSVPGNDKLWGFLCIISFSFVFMNLLFTYPLNGGPTLRDLFSRYLMLIGIIGMYAATTRAVETMSEAAQAKAELDVTKKRVSMQESYYERLASQMDEMRRMRHDLRHHKAVIAAMIKSGDIQALGGYIDEVTAGDELIPVTGNLAADSVILYYTDTAKSLGITVKADVAVSRGLPVSDADLCVILGNLLENAVEAQTRVPQEKRYIRVSVKSDESGLTLAVDNRFDGMLKTENGIYLSGKSGGGHGLGISSVRIVCEKYGGVFQLEADGDMFMAGVVIGI